jgi:hypothetical protein
MKKPRTNRLWLLLFLMVALNLPAFSTQPQNDSQEARIARVLESITSDELMEYVHELADPKYGGRLAGHPDYMKSAAYVADKLKSWGVEPLGDDGSFYQYFPWHYSEVRSTGKLVLHSGRKKTSFQAPDDYYPGANSYRGKIKADVVFVGFGISAPELGYDDYAGIDVKGKLVMIASATPYTGREEELLNQWGPYSGARYKFANAREKGAAGVLYLDKMANPGAPYFPGFYYANIGPSVIGEVFSGMGKSADDVLKEIRENMKPNSFAIPRSKMELVSDTRYFADGMTANVVGYIPGNDPKLKEEAIIIGAHLDGQGNLGFHFPSALDNASGVADVMAAARALAHFKGEMKRSVVFIFFGAEEVGLVGSIHYCENPSFGPRQTLTFMNLDMVGNGSGLAVWGGLSYPGVYQHFQDANETYMNRSLRATEARRPVGRARTDGAVFAQHGYPTLHISTTDRVNALYYHDPRDTADLLVPDIMRDVSRMLFRGIFGMANDETLKVDEQLFFE